MPHCDSLNGPVVLAAKKSLETGNVHYVLIWVPENAEEELQKVFDKVLVARTASNEAQEIADQLFFETAVRLHRMGEGEGFVGIKPEMHKEPLLIRAEKAIENQNAEELIDEIEDAIEDDLERRFHNVLEVKNYPIDDIVAGRKYVKAYIEFVVYAFHLYASIKNNAYDTLSKHVH